jgi:hypothetical protein
MTYRWETPASIWQEDERSGEFALLATEGLGQVDWQAHARGRLPDVAHLIGASLPTACTCAPIFPEGFTHCPHCGRALLRLNAAPSRQPGWWGPGADQALPRHVPHGLPVTSLALGDSLEERPAAPSVGRADLALPAPPNAYCVFAAAGFGFPGQRLLALACGRGVLQYWDPLARLWHVLAPDQGSANLAFGTSAYAWLPALDRRRGEVGLVPTASGLHRLWINPISETCRTEPVLAAPLAASPGIMRRQIGVLRQLDDGGVRLWSARIDLADPEEYACPGAPASGWSRPIGYDGRLFWLHEQGELGWRPGDAPVFTPWPPGWSPRLAFGGPTQSRDGRLWQLGHDGQEYSFLELGAQAAGQAPTRVAIDGARLGFANFLFRRGHPVVDEPWSLEHVEDQHEDDSLVLPLLRSFNNNRAQPSGLVLRIHKYTGRAEDALGERLPRTTVEWIGRRNVILDEIPRLSRPLECLPLVYDNCLWLHHPDWNQMRGWRLDELS